jgi:hypothetical protein
MAIRRSLRIKDGRLCPPPTARPKKDKTEGRRIWLDRRAEQGLHR